MANHCRVLSCKLNANFLLVCRRISPNEPPNSFSNVTSERFTCKLQKSLNWTIIFTSTFALAAALNLWRQADASL
jgi:hypothetical protein